MLTSFSMLLTAGYGILNTQLFRKFERFFLSRFRRERHSILRGNEAIKNRTHRITTKRNICNTNPYVHHNATRSFFNLKRMMECFFTLFVRFRALVFACRKTFGFFSRYFLTKIYATTQIRIRAFGDRNNSDLSHSNLSVRRQFCRQI